MARLTVGKKMPDFTFETPFRSACTLQEAVGRVPGKTAVVFLRYYGCPLCQYDMHRFAEAYKRITDLDGQLFVVLQSAPDKLAEKITGSDFPYEIICDPQQTLYRAFGIATAASREALADEATTEKVRAAVTAGFRHGEYEGEELQLPAVFVMAADRTLTYIHYGKTAGDVPTPMELESLLA